MVQISLQNSGGKVVFLGGSMEPPLGTNGSKSTLVTFKWHLKVLKEPVDPLASVNVELWKGTWKMVHYLIRTDVNQNMYQKIKKRDRRYIHKFCFEGGLHKWFQYHNF